MVTKILGANGKGDIDAFSKQKAAARNWKDGRVCKQQQII